MAVEQLIMIPAGATGIDFAWWRPGAAVKPWAFVVRYLSTNRTNGKNITRAEIDFYHSLGIAVLLVWEQGAADWTKGAELGAIHGAAAVAFAQSLGYPRGAVILCAFDSNAAPGDPRALAYGTAFADACMAAGYDFGPYADLDVIRLLADRSGINWLAGATSWSDPTKPYQPELMPDYDLVHVRQTITGSTPNYDANIVLRPFPAWLPHDVDIELAPAPPAPPERITVTQEDNMGIFTHADPDDEGHNAGYTFWSTVDAPDQLVMNVAGDRPICRKRKIDAVELLANGGPAGKPALTMDQIRQMPDYSGPVAPPPAVCNAPQGFDLRLTGRASV